ncbi:hypothetical protein P5V15_014688 [Pogonomyrmex californicus]
MADAIRIERELHAMSDLRRGNLPKTQNINLSREVCQLCHKDGHLASNCKRFAQNPQQNFSKLSLNNEILICQICKKKRGHDASKCRMRDLQFRRPINDYDSRKNDYLSIMLQIRTRSKSMPATLVNSLICQWCDRHGHSVNNCWKEQNEQRVIGDMHRIICQNCNNLGHIVKDSRSEINQNSGKDNIPFCRYCKEQGHLLENCELRIASNNQRMAKNLINSNGPSKPGVQQRTERTLRSSTSSMPQ